MALPKIFPRIRVKPRTDQSIYAMADPPSGVPTGAFTLDDAGNMAVVYPTQHWNPICPQSWIRWQHIDSNSLLPQPTAAGVNAPTFKADVRAVAVGAITLSGLQTLDTVVLAAGDRVLVANQAGTGAQPYATHIANGIYIVGTGAWTRATDADASGELALGTSVTVLFGSSTLKRSVWTQMTSGTIIPGTTAHAWGRSGGDYEFTLPYTAHVTFEHNSSHYRSGTNEAGGAITDGAQTITEIMYLNGAQVDIAQTIFASSRITDNERVHAMTWYDATSLAAGIHRIKNYVFNWNGQPRAALFDSLLTIDAWPVQFKYILDTGAGGGGLI